MSEDPYNFDAEKKAKIAQKLDDMGMFKAMEQFLAQQLLEEPEKISRILQLQADHKINLETMPHLRSAVEKILLSSPD